MGTEDAAQVLLIELKSDRKQMMSYPQKSRKRRYDKDLRKGNQIEVKIASHKGTKIKQ